MARPCTVVAIIAAHNEADVIEHVVVDLIDQGVSVYYIDDDSTDGTREIVEGFLGRGVLAVERFDSRPGVFEWERILQRKAELASRLDADWFIHHDADEFRESPWAGVPLGEGIAQVDALGFNAIDFALLNFWPVEDTFQAGSDVREVHRFCEPGESYNRLQIRCWKKSAEAVNLTESGGHEARFHGRDVFPIPFLLRHYPIRSVSQGRRKVGPERRARYIDVERSRGWHVQYDALNVESGVLRSAESLRLYDAIGVRRALLSDGEEAAQSGSWSSMSSSSSARAEQRRQLADALARADTLAAELDRLLHALEEQQRTMAEQRQHVAQVKDALAQAEHRVQDLHASLSWRCAAPARAVYRLLTGRSH